MDESLGVSSGFHLLCIRMPAAPPLLTRPCFAGQQDAGAELWLYRGKHGHAGGTGGPWGAGHNVGSGCCTACVGVFSQHATAGMMPGAGAASWDSHIFFCLQVQHYVEKPSTFVSEIINCGIYLFTPAIFQHIGEVFQRNQQELVL